MEWKVWTASEDDQNTKKKKLPELLKLWAQRLAAGWGKVGTWFPPQFLCPPLPWHTYYWPLSKVKYWFLMSLWSTQHDCLWSDQWMTQAWQCTKQDENGLELLMLPSVFTGQLPRQVRTYFHQALKVGFITCIFLSNFVNKTVQEDVVTNAKLFIQAADEVG